MHLYRITDWFWKLIYPELKNLHVTIYQPRKISTGNIYTSFQDLQHAFQIRHDRYKSTPFVFILSSHGKIILARKTIPYNIYLPQPGPKPRTLSFYQSSRSFLNSSVYVAPLVRFFLFGITTKAYQCPHPNTTDSHAHMFLKNGNILVMGRTTYSDQSRLINSFTLEEFTHTGNRVHSWQSSGHIDISELNHQERSLYSLKNRVIDLSHANGMDEMPDGSIVVSCRHTDQIMCIDRYSDRVIWRLGGIRSDFIFIDDPRNGFSKQHFPKILPNGNILIYDNGNDTSELGSRIVEYALDYSNKTATLVWEYHDPHNYFTTASGSCQRLPNGNTLIGWGNSSIFVRKNRKIITEIDSQGNALIDITYDICNAGLFSAVKY